MDKKEKKKFTKLNFLFNNWNNIKLIFQIYLVAIAVFSCFRLILFFTEIDKAGSLSENYLLILQAFIMGLRFDTVISCYILVLPFLILSVMFIINRKNQIIEEFTFYYILLSFSIAFFLCAVDIPFFNQFFSRLSVTALEWADSPVFVLKMVFQEIRYWIMIIPFISAVFLFYISLKKIYKRASLITIGKKSITLRIIFSIMFFLVMFIGIRGRVEKKSPIRIGTSYFSNNPFLNQLGLNPVFTFLRSYLDNIDVTNSHIRLMDDKEALNNVQKYLFLTAPDTIYPIYRKIIPDSFSTRKPNIVIIIMESMSSALMHHGGNNNNLTPFLDSLADNSLYFENVYTSGIHTFNGVFSTLFSYPAIFRQHPMKESRMVKYNNISNVLKQLGYSTGYYTTHDGQFDNIEGFLRANDFDNVITQSDYPSSKVATTLGVPDDYMFSYALPQINELSKNNKPFFVAFMTASNHGPYYIPDYFNPRSKTVMDAIVEYSDWALQKFISDAKKQVWFENTIFVFIADHGIPITANYELPLDYHHTPLIIYAPNIIGQSHKYNCLGGQIDVFPTIMGLINQPYINNTLGIDLLKQKRDYIYFSHDDKYGVLDSIFYLIVRQDGTRLLFKYITGDKTNYINEYKRKADEMELYAKSNFQAYQYLILKNKQYVKR
ncbi:MAG: sulfatase-like hydrolase/transferase [Ignavibacteriae bacterium]|nr:sulfatase-like hydrolase/transferase [Ignavibacteriota bacterium]